MASERTQATIERQLAEERAGVLSCATEALERALAELARGAPDPRVRRYLLEEAAERLWYLVVTREAVGLSRHDVVYEMLRVPAEVRRRMGPRPRR